MRLVVKFALVIAVFLVVVALAQNVDKGAAFSGTIVDRAEGVPIPSAQVWIHEDSGKSLFAVQPDGSGSFATTLPDGYYDVLIGAPGFAPFCKRIWIHDGTPVKLKIKLGPDEANLQR